MSAGVQSAVSLESRFARELPELAVPWRAEDFPDARLVVLNEHLAAELGLDAELLRAGDGVRFLTGAALPPGATPVAQGYAGHQFGAYSPRLGDGRALLLGEVVDVAGRVRDIHLKGSGPTPFTRAGDGLAAIGPMLREYVVSEAMHALGVPTTRSLAVVATGQTVYRETALPGALLVRVASSHLRVGSFQYAAATGDAELVGRLVDFAVARHYPHLLEAENRALALFEAVRSAQAQLVAQWMLLGFVHGVMNTDNMTISGETIDYGPCAFLDGFDPAAAYSSIDVGRRYAYGNQPAIAGWNLARFAETLLPAFHENRDEAIALAQEALDAFGTQYSAAWSEGFRAKIGLREGVDEAVTGPLIGDLVALMQGSRVDGTSFFRRLADAARGVPEGARGMFIDLAGFDAWLERWKQLAPDPDAMDAVNPVYIPRNHLVEEALAAATDGDLAPLGRLWEAVTDPYTQRPGFERYAEPAPEDFGAYRTFCGT
ncbi:protein adenylyltransferase SelO [Microbacterium sp. NPDC096154]|uniref:protein adenylyltransferase SelO n=1 Tax=Microbacterium sp. NPDC096154 TaxID=3155549 RepID=UPI0033166F84